VVPGNLRREADHAVHGARRGTTGLCIELHNYSRKMIIVLDWKTFESPLVNMTFPRGTVVSVVTLRMRQCHPSQKVAHSAVLRRP